MTRVVLDKNPEAKNSESLNLLRIFEENLMTLITYSNPFSKIGFFFKLFSLIKIPIIYLDFDLLYSGYVCSKIVQKKEEFSFIRPSKNNWNEIFKDLLLKISKEKHLIILDSLNSMFTMFHDRPDVGRWVNSSVFLLITVAKMTNSPVSCTASVIQKKEEDWILSITGRHLIDVKNSARIHLDSLDSKLMLKIYSKNFQSTKELFLENTTF